MFQSEIKSKINEDISISVQLDNHPWNYICECGDASNWTVKEVQNANAVFISHTHIDHFVNFDMVIRHQIGIQRRVVICGPKEIATQVQAKLKSYTWNLIQKDAILYEIREMIFENEIKVFELEPPLWELVEKATLKSNVLFQEKNFVVTGILLDHKTPTLAYKFKEHGSVKIDIQASGFRGGKWVKELKTAFEQKDSECPITIEEKAYLAKDLFHLLHIQEGDSLGVIMDHAANPDNHAKIIQHFSNCQKVFIESFYKNEDQAFAETNYHSYAAMSGKVMLEAKVENPVPVHFSRKYGSEEIQALVKEFEMALRGDS
jgi:ribonuclease Z